MTNIFGTEHRGEREELDHFPFGEQWTFEFANGYRASVIRNVVSYGNATGRWELAVLGKEPLIEDERATGERWVVVRTPVCGDEDVAGWLDEPEVGAKLRAIEALPKAGA
jgi:hypothetical protein